MLLFAFLVIPMLSFFLYCGLKNSPLFVSPAEYFLLQALGLVCACFYCTIDVFFMVSDRLFRYGFVPRFFSPLFFEIVLPVVILGLLYFIFVKKNISYKAETFSFVLLGFYMIFLPSRLLSYGSDYPFFMIFIKPVLFCVLLYDLIPFMSFFWKKITEKNLKFSLLLGFTGLFLLCLPAFTEVVWLMNIALPIWLLPFGFSLATPYLLSKFFQIRI